MEGTDGRMISLIQQQRWRRGEVGGAGGAAASWRITSSYAQKTHTHTRNTLTVSFINFPPRAQTQTRSHARTHAPFPVSVLNAGPDQRCAVFTFHLAVAVKRAGCSGPQGKDPGGARQPIARSHTRQHFLLLTQKTSPLIGSVVYRQSAGNNNKHVFTPEPFTLESARTQARAHMHTHTCTCAHTQLPGSRLLYLAPVGVLSFKLFCCKCLE